MLRAELLKIRSHRLPWIVYGIYVGVQVVVNVLVGIYIKDTTFNPAYVPFMLDGGAGLIFTTIVASWIGGAEFGWGTWRVVLGRDDRRSLFFGSKVAVLVVVVAVGTTTAVACGMVAGMAAGTASGRQLILTGVAQGVTAAALSQAVYGLVAFSVGMATRSTAVAIAVGLGWFLIVQNLLAAVRQVGPYLLNVSLDTVTATPLGSAGVDQSDLMATLYGIGTVRAWIQIALWLAVFVGGAWLTFAKRDIADTT